MKVSNLAENKIAAPAYLVEGSAEATACQFATIQLRLIFLTETPVGFLHNDHVKTILLSEPLHEASNESMEKPPVLGGSSESAMYISGTDLSGRHVQRFKHPKTSQKWGPCNVPFSFE